MSTIRPSCLLGLFRANMEMVHAQCTILSAPTQPTSFKLEEDKFALFHPSHSRVTVTCDGKSHAMLTFQGMKEVHLRPGCEATTSSLRLWASKYVGTARYRMTVGRPGIAWDQLNIAGHPANHHVRAMINQLLHPVTLHDPRALPPPPMEALPPWLPSRLPFRTVTLLNAAWSVISAAALVFWFLSGRGPPCRARAPSESDQRVGSTAPPPCH